MATSVLPQYVRAAETLLLGARLAVQRATLGPLGDARTEQLLCSAERTVTWRLGNALDIQGREPRAILSSGYLAAHIVHARLYAAGGSDEDDGRVGRSVGKALAAFEAGAAERLGAARGVLDVAPYGGECEGALRDLATVLTRSGVELVAACGHLIRTLVGDMAPYPMFVDVGWWSAYGAELLIPDEIARAAAVNLVVAGRATKTEVARMAGISRTTLDAWFRRYAGDDEALAE